MPGSKSPEVAVSLAQRKREIACDRPAEHGLMIFLSHDQLGCFSESPLDVLAAIDFTTVEVWTKSGLVTFYLLFVVELKTQRVHFAVCTTSSNEDWMKQAARELASGEDGFLKDKQYLIMD